MISVNSEIERRTTPESKVKERIFDFEREWGDAGKAQLAQAVLDISGNTVRECGNSHFLVLLFTKCEWCAKSPTLLWFSFCAYVASEVFLAEQEVSKRGSLCAAQALMVNRICNLWPGECPLTP